MKRSRQHTIRTSRLPVAWLLSALALIVSSPATADTSGDEGSVKFFVDARSDFDPWTNDPSAEQQAWMRENYYRMQTYSPYFDSRLSWYPRAWEYKDAYAIKPSWDVFTEHPEWILRDSNGQMLYIPWGCSGGSCPQYAADVGNPEFREWWIEGARAKVAFGYAGIWVDDVNLEWRIGNGDGNRVTPIDPRTGREMTLADWRRYFAEFLELIRAEFPEIELAHNVNWAAEPTDDAYIRREFDAADYINLERGISDSGITGGGGKYGFETFLALVDRIHSRGKNVIMDDDDDDSVRDRDYELAFYFLINNGGDLISADGDRSRMNPDNFWSGYQTELGAALGERYEWNGLYRRDFDCGLVLVNPPDRQTISVDLGGTFTDLAGAAIDSTDVLESSGEVLINASCLRDILPNPPVDLQVID